MYRCCVLSSLLVFLCQPNPLSANQTVQRRKTADYKNSVTSTHLLTVSPLGDDGWAAWSTWSKCSRTCGLGVTTRTRHCSRIADTAPRSSYKQLAAVKAGCIGVYRQYNTCNPERCPSGSKEFRYAQCETFNNKSFHGRRYQWLPHYEEADSCRLSCRPRRHRFFVHLSKVVADGTRCQPDDPYHICIAGRCQLVGCDGVLGSDRRVDRCRICGGNNSTCHVISGIFTRTRLPAGYNRVTSVPRGACNINVTELVFSPNHLAIKVTGGRYIINGADSDVVAPSGHYSGAGTVFSYRRPASNDPYNQPSVETILADGPTNCSVDIMVVQSRENRGIMYTYTIPRRRHSGRNVERRHHQHQHRQHRRHHHHRRQRQRDHDAIDQTQSDQKEQSERIYGDSQEMTRRQDAASAAHTSDPDHSYINDQARPSNDDPDTGRQRREEGGEGVGVGDGARRQGGIGRQLVDDGQRRTASQTGHTGARPRPQPGTNFGVSVPRYSVAQRRLPGPQPVQTAWPYSGRQIISPYRQPVQYPPVGGVSYRTSPYMAERPYYVSRSQSAEHGYPQPQRSAALNDQIAYQLGPPADIHLPSAPAAGDQYQWKIAGFSECSQSCGGGVQKTDVVCMKVTGIQVVVTDENCDPSLRPTGRTVTCNNTPCPPAWDMTEWSECSTSCDRGQQTRTVECKQRLSAVLSLPVTADRCIHQPRPPTVRACNVDRPCVRWRIGNWSQCSTECGRGLRTREVICINIDDKQVAENLCRRPKPRQTELCDMGSCARTWFYTTWSHECSSACGEGVHHRLVHCSAEPQRCHEITKPKSEKSCKQKLPCGGRWFTGPWGQCTVTCGDGVIKRDVVCMKKLGVMLAVVSDSNCLPDDKPTTEQQCERPACQPRWYMTDWSECTRSCDTGLQHRETKCLDDDQLPSQSCDADLRPEVRRTCNHFACSSSSSPSMSSSEPRDSGGVAGRTRGRHHQHGSGDEAAGRPRSHHSNRGTTSCRDKFKNCRVVVQARLCRYSYYRGVCCFSCTGHGYADSDDGASDA